MYEDKGVESGHPMHSIIGFLTFIIVKNYLFDAEVDFHKIIFWM